MGNAGWRVSLRSLVSVRIRGGIPRLVVHEKYHGYVKWTLRGLAVLGIASSVIMFPEWYWALGFAIVLFLMQLSLGKAVVQYSTIFVQPQPDFVYDPAEWRAMAFAFPDPPAPDLLNVVGCAFGSVEYARKFFRLLAAWNNEAPEDRDDNIRLTFVIENDSEYSVYLFPSPDRAIVRQSMEDVRRDLKLEKYGKEQQQLVLHTIFCKRFPYSASCHLAQFVAQQPPDRPYWLKPFLWERDGTIKALFDEPSILKWRFKCARRDDLGKHDVEYHDGKWAARRGRKRGT